MYDTINSGGRLPDILNKVDIKSIQSSAQIQKGRLNNSTLRSKRFWPIDFALYTVENGRFFLNMSLDYNPILTNISDAFTQLREKNNFFPKVDDVSRVLSSPTNLSIPLDALNLKKYSPELSYYSINTKHYNKLNSSQRKLAERIHGTGDDFYKVMGMLYKISFIVPESTLIYVLNPEYVKNILKKNNAESVSRPCFLRTLSDVSSFFACESDIYIDYGYVRGLPPPIVLDKEKTSLNKPEIYTPSDIII